MWTDFHLHVLPGIDDGAQNVEISVEMLKILKQQQVDSVFATPHFLLHTTDVPSFVDARINAYQALIHSPNYDKNGPTVYMAAEVAIEPDISRHDCLPLCYENLSAILLELPRTAYKSWMYQEIENIRYGFHVTPVLAHLERYLWYEKEDLQNLLRIEGVAVQINANAFSRREGRKLIKELYEQSIPVIIGSDSHNCDVRRPSFDVMESVIGSFRFRKWLKWLQQNQEWFLSLKQNQ